MNATQRRRVIGGVWLAIALLMLIAGETLLRGRLHGLVLLGYWGVCFACTVLAIMVAFLDLRAVRRTTTAAQRELFETTIKDIVQEAENQRKGGTRPPGAERKQA
ncbi:MAG TPA: hypothetical protein VN673_08650 [Clostridia bacterium]|nr:hypothetical protein [Clostridia bacterium]